ncbi:DUF3299 domain-containing protein [Pelagibacterium xiamenense]|uniref:DUF3299 domain-containing protein n=1 Tax=Pelagibacterium xiamenense TaxID=2901140 RepID=UPI001E2D775A|nr:DUF3299 domain-containing protein [Pelagibacterium xiamenense]MCD7061030.1 DUF3299 domain-containing protein [Pelagibacterium xiamenense]
MANPTRLIDRRRLLLAATAFALVPMVPRHSAQAQEALRIRWPDLIPEGLDYGEIIGDGEKDYKADVWIPEFDENGTALNLELDNKLISMAGYVLPLEVTAEGATNFVLVPFVGACIHVPPPPPNQLVFVTPRNPWGNGNLWDPVLVTGQLSANARRTEVAEVGYQIDDAIVEFFQRN